MSTGWDVGSGHHTTVLEVLAVRRMTRDTDADIHHRDASMNTMKTRGSLNTGTNMNAEGLDTCVKIRDIVRTLEVVDMTIEMTDIDLSHTEEIGPQGGKKNMTTFVPRGIGDTRQSLDDSEIHSRRDIAEMMHMNFGAISGGQG